MILHYLYNISSPHPTPKQSKHASLCWNSRTSCLLPPAVPPDWELSLVEPFHRILNSWILNHRMKLPLENTTGVGKATGWGPNSAGNLRIFVEQFKKWYWYKVQYIYKEVEKVSSIWYCSNLCSTVIFSVWAGVWKRKICGLFCGEETVVTFYIVP